MRSASPPSGPSLPEPRFRVRSKVPVVNNLDRFEFQQVLGEGKFSEVVRAVDKKDGSVVAVKVIDKVKIEDEKTLLKLDTEVRIQAACDHPNILKLIGMYDDSTTRCLFMELALGGDLFDRIIDKVVFTEEEAVRVVRQVLSAVQYLHERNIAHRDLKPENLLYMTTEENATLKLCDFGFAKQASDKHDILGTPCGTINYAAPEIVDCEYTLSVDIWAIGCIAYFLLFGVPPFYSEADDDDEVMDQLLAAKDDPDSVVAFPEDAPCSSEAKSFIKRALSVNGSRRPSAKRALQHPWILKYQTAAAAAAAQSPSAEEQSPLWHQFKQLRVSEGSSAELSPEKRAATLNKVLSTGTAYLRQHQSQFGQKKKEAVISAIPVHLSGGKVGSGKSAARTNKLKEVVEEEDESTARALFKENRKK